MALVFYLTGLPAAAFGQSAGSLKGTVTIEDKNTPLHNVIVTIVQLKRSVETDDGGSYEFRQVPPGSYTLLAHLEGFPDAVLSVRVESGITTTASRSP
jgi:iron complex outermembrane receptor protein